MQNTKLDSSSATPVAAIMAGSALALFSIFALTWVDDVSLWEILRAHGHGYQIAYVVLAPPLFAMAVSIASLARSRRWLTGLLAFTMVVPTFLATVVSHGGTGAKLTAIGCAIAMIAAIAVTIRPVGQRRAIA